MFSSDELEDTNDSIEAIDDNDETAVSEYESDDVPQEWDIDFSTGQLTGEKVQGSKAIAVWAFLALLVERYRWEIYPHTYGCELNKLIGQQYSKGYTDAMAETYVKDCLSDNPYILDVTNFTVNRYKENLIISFLIETNYGEERVNTIV